jgi:hypothetical protein
MNTPTFLEMRLHDLRHAAFAATLLCTATLAACGGDSSAVAPTASAPSTPSGPSSPSSPSSPTPATTTVSLAGWPNITGLTITADGKPVTVSGATFVVDSASTLVFSAGGVQLASIPVKANVTLFDLLPTHSCDSSADLAKLTSLLLSLDSDQDPTNGVSIAAVKQPAQGVKLADLSETDLLALETTLTGHSVKLNDALLATNVALDQENWTESLSTRTSFVNDMTVLQNYLDRVLAAFASNPDTLDGFAYLSQDQVASVPATLKNEGIAFDGSTPVFSWRYGLQRTDASYKATTSFPLAFPADIQAVYDTIGNKPDYGHIGDIDIANGKLYAPIEDEDNSSLQSYIAVYDAATLQYTGEKHALPLAQHADGVPWVAVDAPRNQFYTVTWSTAAAGSLNVFDLNTFQLIKTVPLQTTFDGRRVQGGKVFNGMLYASGDSHDAGTAPGTNRKYLYKVDPESGSVITLFSYDEPNRTESEGLAFGPDGTMHVIVLAPYTTPLYGTTTNAKPFDGSYSIDGDDWNPSATLRHYTRAAPSLREQLCKM